jgi:hypothetical protein
MVWLKNLVELQKLQLHGMSCMPVTEASAAVLISLVSIFSLIIRALVDALFAETV